MRLIDADALKEKSYWECYSDPDDDYEYVLVTDIDRAQTIDAVPVVRCKDCKHRHKTTCPFLIANAYKSSADNDFCSRGKRKGEEE